MYKRIADLQNKQARRSAQILRLSRAIARAKEDHIMSAIARRARRSRARQIPLIIATSQTKEYLNRQNIKYYG